MLGLHCKLLPDPWLLSACGFSDLYIFSPSLWNAIAVEPDQEGGVAIRTRDTHPRKSPPPWPAGLAESWERRSVIVVHTKGTDPGFPRPWQAQRALRSCCESVFPVTTIILILEIFIRNVLESVFSNTKMNSQPKWKILNWKVCELGLELLPSK